MQSARQVKVQALYNGTNILAGKVESISYTDNAEGSSDDITLEVDSDYADNSLIPEKEAVLDVTMYFTNWESQGDTRSYHCGTFVLDDITYQGPPDTLTLKAVAAPASEAFSTIPKYKAWENITLKQIAQEIMALYGMTSLYYNEPEVAIANIEQNGETDSSFIKSLCDKYNLCLKIYKMGMVIFSWETYESVFQPKATYSADDFESYTWNTTLNGTYTGAHLKYTVKATSKKPEQVIEVTVGQGPRLLELTDKCKTVQEATDIARQKVNAENMSAITLSFTALGNPNIFASHKIRITGSGRMNGDYMVTKVTHSLSGGSGHKMRIECYKIFTRL